MKSKVKTLNTFLYNPHQKVFHWGDRLRDDEKNGWFVLCEYIHPDISVAFISYIDKAYADKLPAYNVICLEFHSFMGKVFVTEEKES